MNNVTQGGDQTKSLHIFPWIQCSCFWHMKQYKSDQNFLKKLMGLEMLKLMTSAIAIY